MRRDGGENILLLADVYLCCNISIGLLLLISRKKFHHLTFIALTNLQIDLLGHKWLFRYLLFVSLSAPGLRITLTVFGPERRICT